MKTEERLKEDFLSWAKPLWADDRPAHTISGVTPISPAGSWQGSTAGWAPRSPKARGHSRLQVLVQTQYLLTTPWLQVKLGNEYVAGIKAAWSFICFISTGKAQADIRKRQRGAWEENMDVVVRQGKRVKAVDSGYEKGKKKKTIRQEKSRRKETAVFGAHCVYLSIRLSGHFVKTLPLWSPSNVSSRGLCFGLWPAPRSIPGI